MNKKLPVKDIITNMEDMNLSNSIVDIGEDFNSDLFGMHTKSINKQDEDIPMIINRSEYEELFENLTVINDKLEIANIKLNELKSLFHVEKHGDELNVLYRTVFNGNDKYEKNEYTERIFQDFIKRYSLDISHINREIRMIKNLVEAKLLRGKPDYCEVDLLFKEKSQPVEC